MFEYSADELRALRRYDVALSRPVRKAIFSLRLWRPVRQRRHDQRQLSRDRCLSTNRGTSNQLIIGCLNTQSVTRKSALVCRAINEANTDLMVLTETWHECSGAVSLQKAVPDGFECIDAARPIPSGTDVNTLSLQNHGGIAVIHRRQIELRRRPLELPTTTFENLCCDATVSGKRFLLLCVYRPGSEAASFVFFDEFTAVLAMLHRVSLVLLSVRDSITVTHCIMACQIPISKDCRGCRTLLHVLSAKLLDVNVTQPIS